MNGVRYSDWQAIIRLPSYVYLAVFLDQKLRVDNMQTTVMIRFLSRLASSGEPGDILTQLAQDSLNDFANNIKGILTLQYGNFYTGSKESIHVAKQVLSIDSYQTLTELITLLTQEMHQQKPIYKQLIQGIEQRLTGQNKTSNTTWLLQCFAKA